MELTALNVRSTVIFSSTDVGSGICRASTSLFDKLGGKFGSVVHLSLQLVNGVKFEVLCTLWPDSNGCFADGEICVDDTVQLKSGNVRPKWSECKCQILKIHPAQVATSIHIQPLSAKHSHTPVLDLDISSFIGLAVGVRCRVWSSRDGEEGSGVLVSRVSGAASSVSVATSCTLLIKLPPERSLAAEVEEERGGVFSNIAAVSQLVERVVRPAALLPSFVQYKGVMLLGPPGVGKTYAVRAAQRLCRDWCQVHIVELSIPMLLADSQPLERLERLLSTVSSLRRRPLRARGDAVNRGTEGSLGERSPMRSPAPSVAFAGSVTSTSDGAADGLQGAPKTPLRYTGVKSPGSAPGSSTAKFTHQTPVSSNRSTVAARSSARTPKTVAVAEEKAGSEVDELTAARNYFPELVFVVVDEIDALGKPGSHNELQMAIKSSLCQWMDAVNRPDAAGSHGLAATAVRCCVLATSNRSDDIDVMFRRGGRLEHEIVVVTTQRDRAILMAALLTHTFRSSGVSGETILTAGQVDELAGLIAERTGGYVAADLVALVREMHSLHSRGAAAHGDAVVTHMLRIFDLGSKAVPPSCLRGVSIQLPSLSYADVVGYEEVKRSLRRVLAFSSPAMMTRIRRFNLGAPGGVLLHGPPGNSKTRLVMAAAAHHGLPVISLSSADVFSPYVGDAEAEIRKAFRLARQARPCVLFLDELDSIVTNREAGGAGSSSGVEGRVLATLLTEMDGVAGDDDRAGDSEASGRSNSGGVIVLGATNRLDFIDPALIRKGRFHHVLHVPLPNEDERRQLIEYFARRCQLSEEALQRVRSKLREGLCGADIENICREEVLQKSADFDVDVQLM